MVACSQLSIANKINKTTLHSVVTRNVFCTSHPRSEIVSAQFQHLKNPSLRRCTWATYASLLPALMMSGRWCTRCPTSSSPNKECGRWHGMT